MIRFYDTAKRKKIDFTPLQKDKVGIYVCGPTVYDHCHIGHARCYVAFDTIIRILRNSGLETTYVRNITDIDDKIINRAAENNEDALALSARFTDSFHNDMAQLGNISPDVEPKVSEHLPEIIQLIESLIEKNHAYAVDGDVYFEVNSLANYGEISGRNLEDLRSGARIDVDNRKRSPFDFALWKSAKPEEPSWDSPWGKGRPGWHIECSAMSGKYLGESFDIHGGGMDLIFPHHENENAQSRGCYGPKSFAQHWLHNGFINVKTAENKDEKMSKSLGNFFTVREVCNIHEAEALRIYLLGTHFRKPISFEINRTEDGGASFPGLEESERRLAYYYQTLAKLDDVLSVGKDVDMKGELVEPADSFKERFEHALQDDFNTAAALGFIAELFTMINKLLDQPKSAPKATRRRTLQFAKETIRTIQAWLGLFSSDPNEYLERRKVKLCKEYKIDPQEVEELIKARGEARANKDFEKADQLRDQLVELKVEIMDRPTGTVWSVLEN